MKAHTQNTHFNDCIITHHSNTPMPAQSPIIIGIDEVGRGSLFGQMTVGAVIMPSHLTGEFGQLMLEGTPLSLLNDSKKLTAKKRGLLFTHIQNLCHDYVLVDIPAFVIDKIDIYQATLLGMRLSIEYLLRRYAIDNHQFSFLIDGNAKPQLTHEFTSYQSDINTLIKGDGRHSSIACASILAKVHRDTAMDEYAKRYPDYHIDKHKGYASKVHTDAIHTHGILPEHRKTFNPMRTILATQNRPAIHQNNELF